MSELWRKLQDALRSIRMHILQEGFAEAVYVGILILIVLMTVSLAAGYLIAVNYEEFWI